MPVNKTMPGKSGSIDDVIACASKIFTPAWPLQNTVAVNPFWNMRDDSFCEVLSQLNPIFHQKLLMPLEYYQKKFADGEISQEGLAEALRETRSSWQILPQSLLEFIDFSPKKAHADRDIKTIAEITPHDFSIFDFVIHEIGKFSAAYFDQNQAVIKFPFADISFWKAWLRVQQIDRSMMIAGFSQGRTCINSIAHFSPEQAITFMLSEMGVTSVTGQYLYLQRANASVLGWGSQFRFHEWQANLGYGGYNTSKVIELVAVRVAYDYMIYSQMHSSHKDVYQQWSDHLNCLKTSNAKDDLFLGTLYTWHMALEFSYQIKVGMKLARFHEKSPQSPRFSLVFCIDVRSEMIRRHIENIDHQVRTIGFAGFFAAPLDYKKCDEKSIGHHLPVLLRSSISIAEDAEMENRNMGSSKQMENSVFASYFRNLRKMPLSSFLFVELFGILSIIDILSKTLRSLLRHDDRPSRFFSDDSQFQNVRALSCDSKTPLTNEEMAAVAANSLKNMGFNNNFSKLNIIVGHGAETSNNAFASALDCGACGGHAGDVNARFLASLLNSDEIRALLKLQGIYIPKEAWFAAAIHETVTDEIYILDEHEISDIFRKDLLDLEATLKVASANCRLERQNVRSRCLDSSSRRRRSNWSEVRPEWGLAGNACFIVAPRSRTRGINLSSRAFLHDYDWKLDPKFTTLDVIMTAPMIVTNWINMQYFGSVVAPGFYGSGNKVLHNITNETGVVEGNGGDLRVGLPIQSVHDGEQFTHDPLRLTVFIEAPTIEIEKIIEKHTIVRELIQNQWLHIVQINDQSGISCRRLCDGTYKEFIGT